MALVNCSDCKAEVSDQAKTCPKCGAKLKGSIVKWFFIVPAVLLVIFLGYGASIPKNDADALAAYNRCRDQYAAGKVTSLFECEQIEARIRAAGK